MKYVTMLIREYNHIKDLSEASRYICRICPSSITLDHNELLSTSILHVSRTLTILVLQDIFVAYFCPVDDCTTTSMTSKPSDWQPALGFQCFHLTSGVFSTLKFFTPRTAHWRTQFSWEKLEFFIIMPTLRNPEHLTWLYNFEQIQQKNWDNFCNKNHPASRWKKSSIPPFLASQIGWYLLPWRLHLLPSGTEEPVVIYRTCPGFRSDGSDGFPVVINSHTDHGTNTVIEPIWLRKKLHQLSRSKCSVWHFKQ